MSVNQPTPHANQLTRGFRPPIPGSLWLRRRRRARVSRDAALPLLGVIFAALMLGGTLPIPLYTLWAPKLGFGALTTTLIFAAYTVGTIAALLTLAHLSDEAGRRPMLLVAIVSIVASTALFLVADSVVVLLLARFVSGAATGIITATATAGLHELDRESDGTRSVRTATLANMGGLGPAFLRDVLHERNLAIVGVIVGSVFLIGATTQVALNPARAGRALAAAPVILIAGLAGIEAGRLTIPAVVVGVLNQSLSARGATLIVACAVTLLALAAGCQNLIHHHHEQEV
jgi:MFS family permease